MNRIGASVLTISLGRPFHASAATFGALVWSGFRRYATYRQAAIAGSFTNIVFGFLRCYVLLAVAAGAAGNSPGGYDVRQLATYVWVGQGLLSVVGVWGWTELADRIRTGDIAADLLRPVPPVVSYLAADLGRSIHSVLTRVVGPLIAGALFFPLAIPQRWQTVPLFCLSVLLAVVGSFGCRSGGRNASWWCRVGELRANIRVYGALAGGKWRSMLSYRASFVAELLSNLGATVLDVVTVFVLFRATATIGGFTLAEAILMTGLTAFGFVLADMIVGNIDDLKRYVRSGTLDTMLTRPLPLLPQLIFTDLPLRKLLRLGFGAGVYGLALAVNDIDWTVARVLLAAVAPVAGGVFFGAIFVLTASFAFWWVESGEIGHGFTYGGRDFTSYPITVYSGWFRDLFAYALGFGFVAYQPALALLGRTDPLDLPAWAGYASPLVALPAVVVAALVWRTGLRHYRSTGS